MSETKRAAQVSEKAQGLIDALDGTKETRWFAANLAALSDYIAELERDREKWETRANWALDQLAQAVVELDV